MRSAHSCHMRRPFREPTIEMGSKRRETLKRKERRKMRDFKFYMHQIVLMAVISMAVIGAVELLTGGHKHSAEANLVETNETEDLDSPIGVAEAPVLHWTGYPTEVEIGPTPLPTRDLSTVKINHPNLEECNKTAIVVDAGVPIASELLGATGPTDDEPTETENSSAPFVTGSVPREEFLADRLKFTPQPFAEEGRASSESRVENRRF